MFLHVDLNCFYASCAVVQSEGKYTGETMLAVAGDPEKRHGIILAATYPAKRFGLRAGMPVREALERCPGLVLVAPTYRAYLDYSERFMKIISKYSPLIMQFGIDEAYFDYAGCEHLFGAPARVANEIRERVKAELGLTVSVGIGCNMIRAKMGSDHKKPDAVTYLDDDAWKKLIWPKPVEDLMYIGGATGRKLRKIGINTIGQLAAYSPTALKGMFGVNGREMWMHANGLDERTISPSLPPQKELSHSMTTPIDLVSDEDKLRALLYQTERAAFRLREMKQRATVVGVQVRYADLSFESKRAKLPRATDITEELYLAGRALMLELPKGKPVRLVGIQLGGLTGEGEQAMLFDGEERESLRRLDSAIDALKRRYGPRVVSRGGAMGREYGEREDFTPFKRG